MATKIETEVITLQEKLDVLQRITNTGDWEWDIKKNVIVWSDETCRIFGAKEKCDPLPFEEYLKRIPSRDRVKVLGAFNKAKKEGSFDVKHRISRKDERYCIVRFRGSIVLNKHDKPKGMVGTIQDITRKEQKRIADDVVNKIVAISLEPLTLEEIFDKILKLIFSIPWISIESKGGIFLNDCDKKELNLISQVGFPLELKNICSKVAHGKCLCGRAAEKREVVFSYNLDKRHDICFENMEQHGHYCIPIELGDKLLGVLNLYLAHNHIRSDEEESVLNIVANTLAALIDRKNKQKQLEMLAHYDALTELPNWRFFIDQMKLWINGHNGTEGFSILFIDLDRFKTINDTLGHAAGDLLLQKVAKRLKKCIRREDFLGRKSGDEFVLGIRVNSDTVVSAIAQKVVNEMSAVFELDGAEGRIGASVGISSFPEDSEDIEVLLQLADTAMFHAKEQGRNNYVFYSDDIQSKTLSNHRMLKALETSIVTMEDFDVHYQPQVNLETGAIVGCEALMRWRRPDTGEMVLPNDFISVAEEANLISILGEWIFRKACRQMQIWMELGIPPIRMGVNVSPKQIRTHDFKELVGYILKEYNVNPSNLEIEITETAIEGREEEQIISALHGLNKLGISIALDDYGTGQSSLRRLRKFPARTLKIDRSFIKDFLNCEDQCAIVSGTIGLGKNIGKVVIAEGVETEHQRKALLELGCDEIQGSYFSKPVPVNKMEELLLQNLLVLHKELGKGHSGEESWGWSIRKAIFDI